MEIKYQICYLKEVIQKHIPNLLLSARSLRVSDYRVVYRIESEIKTVVIVAIKHRKDVYQDT